MNPMRASCVLLTCVVLSASAALLAAPREPVPPIPDNWKNMYEHGRLTDEETRGANPCIRPDGGTEFNPPLHPRRKGARLAMCVGRVKSEVVASAWEKGLDEYGVQLRPDAAARKQAESELWLRRLVGKYRIEGEYWVRDGGSPISGTADCAGVGGGSGVICGIKAKWKAPPEKRKDPNLDKSLYNAVQPVVLLFGIDPGTSQVRVTLVDFRAIRMQGFLVDGAVIFDVKSDPELDRESMLSVLLGRREGPFPLVTYTWANSRVAVKQGGDVDVQFMVRASDPTTSSGSMEFDLKLRREH